MKKQITSFVAVDFETMTSNPASICAAGFVKVKNGVIHEQYYTLVNPVESNEETNFTWLHGITNEMTASAPKYPTAHAKLADMLSDGSPLVCHNAQADVRFIEACQEYYKLDNIVDSYIDTYQLSGVKLSEACKEYNIDLHNHHDALCDARACALLLLSLQGIKPVKAEHSKPSKYDYKKIKSSTLTIPTEDEIDNKNTIFYHSNCVITGKFDSYPAREELASDLRKLGADINTSISGKTTIVVMGEGAGPKKIEKIEELRAKGQKIDIIDEDRLLEILESAGM